MEFGIPTLISIKSPRYQVVFISVGGGGGVYKGAPKDRMLATLLSRDERDQLQAGL